MWCTQITKRYIEFVISILYKLYTSHAYTMYVCTCTCIKFFLFLDSDCINGAGVKQERCTCNVIHAFTSIR